MNLPSHFKRRLLQGALITAAAAWLACGGGTSARTLEFDLERLDGGRLSSSSPELKGEVVLIDIWGTWCPPCREAIPHLTRLYNKFSNRGLVVIGAAYENGTSAQAARQVRALATKMKIPYELALGGESGRPEDDFRGLSGFSGFPTLIVVGRDGFVKKIEVGFSEDAMANLETLIDGLLGPS